MHERQLICRSLSPLISLLLAHRVRRSARTKRPIVKEPIVDESSTESEAETESESEAEIKPDSDSAEITDPSEEEEAEEERVKTERKKKGERVHVNLPLPRGLSDTGAGVSAPKEGERAPVRSKGALGRLTQEAQQSSGKDLLGKRDIDRVAHHRLSLFLTYHRLLRV